MLRQKRRILSPLGAAAEEMLQNATRRRNTMEDDTSEGKNTTVVEGGTLVKSRGRVHHPAEMEDHCSTPSRSLRTAGNWRRWTSVEAGGAAGRSVGG